MSKQGKGSFVLPKGHQLCCYCKKYCGGCPWTEIGEDGKVKFEPVPGWTATPSIRTRNGKVVMEGYAITQCPLFVEDRREDFHPEPVIISMIRSGLTDRQISVATGVAPNDVAEIRHKAVSE